MATVEEERAKVKLGTGGGSIYTPGTPTMRAQGAMNSNVASALRGAVAANPQMNYAAGAGQGIRQAYEEGGLPRAIGKTIASTVAAPYEIAKDTVAGAMRDVGEFGRGVVGGFTGAPVSAVPVEQPQVSMPPAAVASPQVQTMPAHGGIRTVAQVQPPVEEGGGMIRDSQTGEVVRMDSAGNISRFDSAGNPISKLSPRQWGGAQPSSAAPAPRGLTVTNPDGTTEFFPASTEQAPTVWGLRPAAQEQAATGYVPREIKTWGDWMAEKKERAAYGLNTQRMMAEAGATKTMAEIESMPAERQSIQGLRAAQAAEAQAKVAGAGEERGLKKQYYDILKKGAETEAAKVAKPTIADVVTGQDRLGRPVTTKGIVNADGSTTLLRDTPSIIKSIQGQTAMLDAKKQEAWGKWVKSHPNIDPMTALRVIMSGKF